MTSRSPRSLTRTVTLAGVGAIAFMTVVVIGAFYGISATEQHATAAALAHAKARALADTVEASDALLKQEAADAYRRFRAMYTESLTLDPAVGDATPTMRDGILPINGDTAAVDRFAEQVAGGTATVFAKVGDDFERITTSVKKENGDRATGTRLGKQHPGYAALMAGKPYVGRAVLFGKPFVTVYEPARDEKGNVIGIFYIGLNVSAVQERLADMVGHSPLYETGGVYVIDPQKAKNAPTLVFHPTLAGKNLADVLGDAAPAWMARVEAGESDLTDVPSVMSPGSSDARFAAVVPIPSTNWYAVAEVSTPEAMASTWRKLMVLATAICIGSALMIFGLVTLMRRISVPLTHLRARAEVIGAGDLTQSLATDRQDEVGTIQNAIERMRIQLADALSTVRGASDNIAMASGEVAAGTSDLSQRTEQTASHLQRAASAMEELTGTVRQTAESASTANQLSRAASDAAGRGGDVVSQVVTNMTQIADASRRIADIIGVIDGIAFQTNILALNAAVEAARAGEQGRGFAVVAGEVRTLAGRSAEAAREIKALIGTSVERVENGSRLVQDAGSSMNEIVDSVRRVSDIIDEISTAAAEQRAGIEQVNDTVLELDQMTQQNAALVEESSAAAESLRDQAGKLQQVVTAFKVNGHPAAAMAPVRTAASTSPAARTPAPKSPAQAAPARAPAAVPAATVASDDWETF